MRAAGKAKGIAVEYSPAQGKGSHGMLRFGGRRTTLKGLRKEIGAGLLLAMLKQLGLTKADIGL